MKPNKTKYFTGKPCKRGHVSERYKRNGMCIQCEKERVTKWRDDSNNKESYNDYHRDYHESNLYHLRRLVDKPEEYLFSLRGYIRENREQATPIWADKERIRDVYRECLNMSDGMKMDLMVDHIIPISNPKVCGLHIHNNLKIVSRSLKRKKGNKFNPKTVETELIELLREWGLSD